LQTDTDTLDKMEVDHDMFDNESIDGERDVVNGLAPTYGFDFKEYAAKWILKISETRSLTRAATLGIVQDDTCRP